MEVNNTKVQERISYTSFKDIISAKEKQLAAEKVQSREKVQNIAGIIISLLGKVKEAMIQGFEDLFSKIKHMTSKEELTKVLKKIEKNTAAFFQKAPEVMDDMLDTTGNCFIKAGEIAKQTFNEFKVTVGNINKARKNLSIRIDLNLSFNADKVASKVKTIFSAIKRKVFPAKKNDGLMIEGLTSMVVKSLDGLLDCKNVEKKKARIIQEANSKTVMKLSAKEKDIIVEQVLSSLEADELAISVFDVVLDEIQGKDEETMKNIIIAKARELTAKPLTERYLDRIVVVVLAELAEFEEDYVVV